jgi:hypothetical protein
MNKKIEELKPKIQKEVDNLQAIYEDIFWFTCWIFEDLRKFENQDWKHLKIEILTWSTVELEILMLAMIGYDNPNGQAVEHNFVFYLFSYVKLVDARAILENSENFFKDDFLTLELLDVFEKRLHQLLQLQYINQIIVDNWMEKAEKHRTLL